jgi:hypothetical protein
VAAQKGLLFFLSIPKSAPNTTSPKLLIAPGSKSLMRLPPRGAESPSVASVVKEYPAAPACALQKTMPANPIAIQSPSLVRDVLLAIVNELRCAVFIVFLSCQADFA